MTMPTERMRSIRFGMELLIETVNNAKLPMGTRQRADRVLMHYPSATELEALVSRERATLPPDWAVASSDAREFLVELRHRPDSTAAMKWGETVLLRHYPDECDIEHFARHDDLSERLAPEPARKC